MVVLHTNNFIIAKEQDVVYFRNKLKEMAIKIGMNLINQTKLITASSELVRNMLRYANGGEITAEIFSQGIRSGIRLIFSDKGPGIVDIDLAMKEGYSTQRSLGLGLPGAKKLSDEFKIESQVGKGTTVTILKWKK